jgi:hypothetical protein
VAYIADKNAFLLSPTYSPSGVVTVATLKQKIFESSVEDCFMPTRCRLQLEKRLLAPNDINLYRPSHSTVIPALGRSGLASHLMRLDNKAVQGDFFFTEFWPFEESMGHACMQLTYSEDYFKKCRTVFTVPHSEFAKFAFDHINQWLMSYGDHITRPANSTLRMGIDSKGFSFAFDFVNKQFRNTVRSDFNSEISSAGSFTATFLAKDLCIALHSIGELKINSDIQFYWADDAIFLAFETDVAEYKIVVPTVRDRFRKDAAFTIYCPAISKDRMIFQPVDAASDAVFEAAIAESNQSLTDQEIERLIGTSPDDYQEIVEGLWDWDDDSDEASEAELGNA